mgnify:FL=1
MSSKTKVSSTTDSSSTDPVLSRLTDLAHGRTFSFGEHSTESGERVPVATGEFWTSKQRTGNPLHELSYRACFKPQLPALFIEALTRPGGHVLDPFGGRGTTALEAHLRGRRATSSDLNPLSAILLKPRINPPSLVEIETALSALPEHFAGDLPEELLTFYHPKTLETLCAWRAYWIERGDKLTPAENWIRMVATNRLTGHSPGFFSVYTMPPNQAVSVASQTKINQRRNQTPPFREVKALVLRKSRQLLKSYQKPTTQQLSQALVASADHISSLEDNSVDLVVTSPPFLNVVDYDGDNWLRNWFNGLPSQSGLWVTPSVSEWQALMTKALREMHRVLRSNGYVAFEVGEVRKATIPLEEQVINAGKAAGLRPIGILVHAQNFTKTAHCWGIDNNAKGTNTQRISLFQKRP